jgi:hypothetical protein
MKANFGEEMKGKEKKDWRIKGGYLNVWTKVENGERKTYLDSS